MTERARRAVALLAAIAVVCALAVRLVASGPAADPPPMRASGHVAPPSQSLPTAAPVGEGSESAGRPVRQVPGSVRRAARRAVRAYRRLERVPGSSRAEHKFRRLLAASVGDDLLPEASHSRLRGRSPALRPLAVAPSGTRRWTATALTRRGELYLILELAQTSRGLVVTDIR